MFEVEMPVIKERPNKSAQKRIAKAASKLAEHLLRLSEKQILKINLPEDVADILIDAKKIKASNGRNRLLKVASGIIRDDEDWGSEEAVKQYDKIAKQGCNLEIQEPDEQI